MKSLAVRQRKPSPTPNGYKQDRTNTLQLQSEDPLVPLMATNGEEVITHRPEVEKLQDSRNTGTLRKKKKDLEPKPFTVAQLYCGVWI